MNLIIENWKILVLCLVVTLIVSSLAVGLILYPLFSKNSGYRNIEHECMSMDELCQVCECFDFGDHEEHHHVCLSKDPEKTESGKCLTWDCPVAREADVKDLRDVLGVESIEYQEYHAEMLSSGLPDTIKSEETYDLQGWGGETLMIRHRKTT